MPTINKSSQKTPLVSIICNTFNHEQYIRDAIDGFLIQKTNFPYEILIHDDASTDKTKTIIKQYEKQYPDIILPIYQENNQYSQGINITRTYQLPRVKGKYIAICEGDDYWTDPLKLQKQIDILNNNQNIDICTHAVKKINTLTGKEEIIAPVQNSMIIDTKNVILGGGGYVGTSSIVYRTSLLSNIPRFRSYYPIDFTVQVHGALRGGMYYISDIMSTYRYMTPFSWTKNNRNDQEKASQADKKWIKMLYMMNEDTNYQYNNEIRLLLLTDGVSIHNTKEENRKLLCEYSDCINKLDLDRRFRIYLITYFPELFRFLKKLQRR